ncbi:DNA primase family protein [Hominimerdicola sp. 21CYCFAH17_S]
MKPQNDLLEPEDVITLQEFLGYCLLNTTKAQAMLFLVGRGGEGKSRIGVILEKLFGKTCYFDSIVALSKNKFRQGNLVGKTILVDDDMSFEAIKDTSFLKSLVTAETSISVEKKNVQAVQAKLCARAIVFSNGNPTSLYDKTDGWHRRLIVLNTKPVPTGRKPDRYLSEKLIAELDGIFFWALDGLKRLIANDFIFTLSEKTKETMEAIKQENCNIAEFMNDAQAVQLLPDYTTSSVDIYNAYVNWCHGNGLQELKQKSFYDWLYHNCETYNLVPTNKAYNGRNYVRGYVGIRVSYRSHIE